MQIDEQLDDMSVEEIAEGKLADPLQETELRDRTARELPSLCALVVRAGKLSSTCIAQAAEHIRNTPTGGCPPH
jgi:hypothetical protein